jgi:hypothetical protein
MVLKHGPVTSSGKSAPGPDPRIRHRIQIGMFRSIRVDHTNCLQVAIKTHSFHFKISLTEHIGIQQISGNVSSSGIYFYIYCENYCSVFVPGRSWSKN